MADTCLHLTEEGRNCIFCPISRHNHAKFRTKIADSCFSVFFRDPAHLIYYFIETEVTGALFHPIKRGSKNRQQVRGDCNWHTVHTVHQALIARQKEEVNPSWGWLSYWLG